MTDTESLGLRPAAMVGRADLIHALADDRLGPMAEISGFVAPVPRRMSVEPDDRAVDLPIRRRSRVRPKEPPLAALFLQPLAYERFDPLERARSRGADIETLRARVSARGAGAASETSAWREPPPRTLAPGEFEALLPALRRAMAGPKPVDAPDMRRLVRRLGRGEIPREVPRLERRRWGGSVRAIIDKSDHLGPFHGEHLALLQRLKGLFPRAGVISASCIGPEDIGPSRYRGVVVVMTDLGTLSPAGPTIRQAWREAGVRMRGAGCRPVAILPAAPPEGVAGLDEVWSIAVRGAPSPYISGPDRADELSRLIAVAAPAITIQPGLLRDLRRLLADHPANGGPPSGAWLDAAFWASSYLATNPVRAAGADPILRREALAAFAELPADLRARALATIRAWRESGSLLWAEETLELDPDSRELIGETGLEAAAQAWVLLAEAVEADDLSGFEQDAFFRRARRRIPPSVLLEPAEDGPLWQRVFRAANGRLERTVNPELSSSAPPYPDDLEPDDMGAAAPISQTPPIVRFVVRQDGEQINIENAADGQGSPLAFIDSALEAPSLESLPPFWRAATPPAWADAWGCDRHGPWVDFSVRPKRGDPVVQRLRWIPEGTFQMGSPPDEPGRYHWEGPRHAVTIANGYWMFDTPVIQALWRAVMGGRNPSRFKSADRPVDSVSWNDAKAFVDRINALVPDLSLELPSEARWEHACRAGTETALYTGAIDILGDNNATALDPIAWYGGNSGVEFELSNGYDSADWPDKQHPHTRAGSRPVGRKTPNAWGLHDMIGNVWEWCQDHWHGAYDGAPNDGTAWLNPDSSGAERVLRGGSWSSTARLCRSASRFSIDPDVRSNDFGFRCARVQAGAEPGGSRRIRPAERRIAASLSGGAGGGGVMGGGGAPPAPLPVGAPFVIRSDCEHLTFGLTTRPAWASAMGRDRFGLWSEFQLDDNAWPPVKQRMRWIPPGRFTMGSPQDEPGRWEDEGPTHQVTISTGFWLFDTPCTQALWEGVMGSNPSEFKSPSRPVETVSWSDARAFTERLNDRMPGLALGLPTEAQWEYACRAETATALYSGPIDIVGLNNAPALDPIAWYCGNCGQDFELENGFDIGQFAERQYPDTRGGTHRVKGRDANPWGLYDMIGNVWEWCEDHWHGSYEGAPKDGAAWVDPDGGGAGRVLRGGSWFSTARSCRSAARYGNAPGARYDFIGFRCARVQA